MFGQRPRLPVDFIFPTVGSNETPRERPLSDRGTSFTSSIIEELCKILGIQGLQTMPDHPQMNGLVERSHQTIMHMIGKPGEDKKANWPSHLAEIVHAYNATRSTVTR